MKAGILAFFVIFSRKATKGVAAISTSGDGQVKNNHLFLSPQYDEEELEEEHYPEQGRGRSIIFRLTALFVTLVFITFALSSVLPILTWPSLDFLSASQDLSSDPVIEEWRQAVVNVQAEVNNAPRSTTHHQGTGFNISSNGLIITNHHLIEDAATITVSFPDQGTFAAGAQFNSEELDLAILTVTGQENFPTVTLGEDLPQEGDTVIIIGNTLGFSRVIMESKVTGFRPRTGMGEPLLVIDAPIHPGNSGSPVFNEEGQVVGIIFAANNTDGEIQGLAVPAPVIKEILESEKK